MRSRHVSRFVLRLGILAVAAAAVFVLFFSFIDIVEDATLDRLVGALPQLAVLSQAVVGGVVQTVSGFGYYGIFALMLLESVSLPIPSEVILPFSGYLISRGVLDFWTVLFLTTLAGVMGAIVDYFIGYRLVKGGSLAVGRHRLIEAEQLHTVQSWFAKYGPAAVLISRLIPGFRTLISFPAGMARMGIGRFVLYTAAGCLAWNALLLYAGVYLSTNWRSIVQSVDYANLATFFALALLLAILLWGSSVRRRKPR